MDLSFYKDKKVLVTGHTGFKGSWLSKLLLLTGADVTGYSKDVPTAPSLFELLKLKKDMRSINGDVRDFEKLKSVFDKQKPEIVIHLAAQPIVLKSYENPTETYGVNVMGTVNVSEAVRLSGSVKSFINVTTDKVYLNNEWEWGYRECDTLDGFDPYSNSKSCSELVSSSYKRAFFSSMNIAHSTCRAGNVIGGGDFAPDRIIPDCIRAVKAKSEILIRNPRSVRPYQHVLEPVTAYLSLAALQYENISLAGAYNIGPDECDSLETERLVKLFCDFWGDGASYRTEAKENVPHEANFLKLDCSKIKRALSWSPVWHIEDAVEKTVEWAKAHFNGEDLNKITEKQIDEYLKCEAALCGRH